MKEKLFFDIECYPNYFLVYFKTIQGKKKYYELDQENKVNVKELEKILNNYTIIGFNSRVYDIPMLVTLLNKQCNYYLKARSDELINTKVDSDVWNIIKKHSLWCPYTWDHIDLREVIKKTKEYVSLKMYGARIHTKKIQDLPFDPNNLLNSEQKIIVRNYCENDLNITIDIYKQIEPAIEFREQLTKQYNINFKSDSDANIAEKLVKKFLNLSNVNIDNYTYKYKAPTFLKFKSSNLKKIKNDIEDCVFDINKDTKIDASTIKQSVDIGGKTYTLGVGGLHSTEKNKYIIANEDEVIIDIDVASYYPSLILNNDYYPKHLSDQFKALYENIYKERIKALNDEDKFKADVFKLLLNIPFGKYGNKYSVLYAPDMLLSTTITGQLLLLWLIEKLEEYNFNVISANTDGITTLLDKSRQALFIKIIKAWELKTNFNTKDVYYKALYNQSVNSYVAIKTDGSLKLKNVFSDDSLYKNPLIGICKKAAIDYMRCGNNCEDIIRNSKDIKDFIGVRKVAGGGYYKGNYLGKTVRWYYGKDGDYIINAKGHKVSFTDGCVPIMDLSDEVKNIDYDRYVSETIELLKTVGLFGGLEIKKKKVKL